MTAYHFSYFKIYCTFFVLLNLLFKILKWIEERKEKLYIEKIQ
jgi:hypothetical protein